MQLERTNSGILFRMSKDLMSERAATLLRGAPGPAPWFSKLWPAPPEFQWEHGADAVRGISPSRNLMIRIPMYWSVLGVAPGEITLLDTSEVGTASTYRFDGANREIAEEPQPVFDLNGRRIFPFLTSARRIVSAILGFGSNGGIHNLQPLDVASLPDVVSVPGRGPRSESTDGSDGGHAAASFHIWRPRDGTMQIVPLKWFNSGSVDLGYQWITRCAFDPETNWIFGDGFRIGRFAVDLDGKVQWGNPLSSAFIWPAMDD